MSRHLYIGRSGSGKTTLLIDQIQKACKANKQIDHHIVLIAPHGTLLQQDKWVKIKKWIKDYHTDIDETISYMLYGKAMRFYQYNQKHKKKKNLILIFDDMGESTFLKLVRTSNAIRNLIAEARHFDVHIFMLFQSLVQGMPLFRDNADYIYCFRLENENSKKLFKQNFFGDLTDRQFINLTTSAWYQDGRPTPYGYLEIDRADPNNTKYYTRSGEVNKDGHPILDH